MKTSWSVDENNLKIVMNKVPGNLKNYEMQKAIKGKYDHKVKVKKLENKHNKSTSTVLLKVEGNYKARAVVGLK